jgi:uncharacterized membrane protein YiaA
MGTMGTVVLIVGVFVWMVGLVVGTGYLAERKGYSFGLFAVLGLFLGVIALIVALVLPKKAPSFDNATSASPSES